MTGTEVLHTELQGVVARIRIISLLGLVHVNGTATADTDWWSTGRDLLGGFGQQLLERGDESLAIGPEAFRAKDNGVASRQ